MKKFNEYYSYEQYTIVALFTAIFVGIITLIILFTPNPIITRKAIEVKQEEIQIKYDHSREDLLENIEFYKYNTFTKKKVKDLSKDRIEFLYEKNNFSVQKVTVSYKKIKSEFKLKITNEKLEAPQISNLNGLITWNKINNATSYNVYINDQPYEVEDTKFNINQPKFTSPLLKVSVQAISTDNGFANSDYSEELKISKLSVASNIRYEDGMFIWNAVDGATSYKVNINGTSYETTTNNLIHKNLQVGENNIEIITFGDPSNTVPSNIAKEKIVKLENPTDLSFYLDDLIWSSNYLGYKYEIIFEGETYYSNDKKLTLEADFNKEYVIQIRVLPKNKNEVSSDFQTFKVKKYQLDSPKITNDNGLIKWNIINNATGYFITINGEKRKVSTNEYDLSDFPLPLGSNEISVSSFDDHSGISQSNESNILKLNKLTKTDNIVYSNGAFKWDDVSGRKEYVVIINGVETTTTNNILTFDNFNIGSNIIEIKAFGDKSLTIPSEFKVENFSKLSTVNNIRIKDNVLLWNSNESNNEFEVIFNGQTFKTFETKLTLTLDYNKTYSIKIRTLSNDKNQVDSNYTESSIISVKLDVPQITNVNGLLSWGNIEGANKYELLVNDEKVETTNNTFDLNTLKLLSGDVVVKIKAVDRYSNAVDSDYSKDYEYIKIDKISDVTYSDNHFRWNYVTHANEYLIHSSQFSTKVKVNSYSFDEFIDNDMMVTIQNFGDESTTIPSDKHSQLFKKFVSVSEIRLSGRYLAWDSEYTGVIFLLRIRTKDTSTAIIKEVDLPVYVIESSLDIDTLEVEVTVKGDGKYLIDSIPTFKDFSIKKLKQPKVDLREGYFRGTFIVVIEESNNEVGNLEYHLNIEINRNGIIHKFDKIIDEDSKNKHLDKIHFEYLVQDGEQVTVEVVAKDKDGVYTNSDKVVLSKNF